MWNDLQTGSYAGVIAETISIRGHEGKEIHACDKTGRWFVALAFLGDTDGGEVTLETQWMVNPLAPAIPLPEDATAQAAVLDLMEYDDRIEPWLVELGQTETGLAAVENFTGSTCQMSRAYSRTARSEENLPDLAMFTSDMPFHFFTLRYVASTRSCASM
jgi:hypothetical protein